jgi:hypothetical protein
MIIPTSGDSDMGTILEVPEVPEVPRVPEVPEVPEVLRF